MNAKTELHFRRYQLKPLVDEITSWEWEYLDKCPVCDTVDRTITATRDRYGFETRLAICGGCGIGYLVERLSKNSYAKLYDGSYRRLLSSLFQQDIDLEFIKNHNKKYAEKLISRIGNDLALTSRSTVLDIGGSTGAVSYEILKRSGVRPIVLDPSEEELEEAKAKGLETILGTIEDADLGDRKFDLVLFCRTAEHVTDLKRTLGRIRSILKPGGMFYMDYLDLVEYAHRDGAVEATARLSHCFYLYNEMIPTLLSHFGFKVRTTYISPTPGHLIESTNIKPKKMSDEDLNSIARKLLRLDISWYRLPIKYSLTDRIRYRLGRILDGGPVRGPG